MTEAELVVSVVVSVVVSAAAAFLVPVLMQRHAVWRLRRRIGAALGDGFKGVGSARPRWGKG